MNYGSYNPWNLCKNYYPSLILQERENNMGKINIRQTKKDMIKWIKNWFEDNGRGCHATIGISGGKDSTIIAALCVEALGKDRVSGVLLPDWDSPESERAREVCEILGITYGYANISEGIFSITEIIKTVLQDLTSYEDSPQYLTCPSRQAEINLPPRLRMSIFYAIAQTVNGRVINTSNLSENYVGYSTQYGDGAGACSPASYVTATELKDIGREIELLEGNEHLIDIPPADDLCGKTDEDNFGFTYEVLDKYIRTGICDDLETKQKIDTMHEKNQFKLKYMDCFKPTIIEFESEVR